MIDKSTVVLGRMNLRDKCETTNIKVTNMAWIVKQWS